MKTIKEITEHLKQGNVLINNKKQLSFCSHSHAYVVNGVKTISINYALQLFNKK